MPSVAAPCMSAVKAGIVLALVALAVSACGGGRRVTFSTRSQVCGLSVPMPSGFHRRFWNYAGSGGVTIGNGPIGPPEPAEWGLEQNRVSLAVSCNQSGNPGGLVAPPTKLQLPIKLHELAQGSGSLTYWSGGGEIGGKECGVAVWLGPDAPAADRSAVLSALQAIKSSS